MIKLRLRGGVKIKIPSEFQRVGSSVNPVIVRNTDGNEMQIHTFDHHLIRVIHVTVAGEYDSGHQLRYGKEHPHPQPTVIESKNLITIKTDKLKLVVTLDDLHLSWSGSDVVFLSDLKYRAYSYDMHAGVHHYVDRNPNTRYYGLGERGSPLDLNGRHFKLACSDALGYNPERSDPLYKNFPFYIGMNDNDCKAYGVYYPSHCTGSIDFGNEIDAIWGDY
jgi:alpha-glucosidase (family GH31 glycosyl hydrolase)